MTHIAIDLGSTSGFSEAVLFHPERPQDVQHQRFQTDHASLRSFFSGRTDVTTAIIESCRVAGWVCDLLTELGLTVLVANTNSDAFRDASKRRKTDRLDALRLMRLYLMGQLTTVTMRSERARWQKQILELRAAVVSEQTGCKNRIRNVLDGAGLVFRAGKSGWTKASIERLWAWTEAPPVGVPGGIWQGVLRMLLERLTRLRGEIASFDSVVASLSKSDAGVPRLQEIPGIGPLTSVAVSASIDDPKRFRTGKQVSRFSGLDPVPFESGKSKKTLGISRRSWSLMRGYLYEACQIGVHRRKDPWFQLQYQRLVAKTGCARKALCAIARRLYVLCWRMLKTGASWAELTAASLATAKPAPA